MYENIFLGHYYVCRNFGHKGIHCKYHARNDYMSNTNDYGYLKNNHTNDRSSQGIVNQIYNPFSQLVYQNMVCYICNNIGQKARNFRNMEENASIIKEDNPTTIGKRNKPKSRKIVNLHRLLGIKNMNGT